MRRCRTAVELDGGQHLGDPEAYQRDRRKDQLLQAHGYFVLRFLPDDGAKRAGIQFPMRGNRQHLAP